MMGDIYWYWGILSYGALVNTIGPHRSEKIQHPMQCLAVDLEC